MASNDDYEDDADGASTSVSEASSEIDLLSQLNDIQTTILTSPTTRGNDSKKELVKQLSLVMVKLLNDENPTSETPKPSSRKSIKTGRVPHQGSIANSVRGGSKNDEITDLSVVSQASSDTNVLSQLNNIQTTILTSPSTRNKNSNKELVKHLAMVTVELLTNESAAHESPKWASAGHKRHQSPVPNTMNLTQNTFLENDIVHRPPIEIPCGDDAVSDLNSSPSMIATRVADTRKARHEKVMEDKEFENAGYLPDIVKDNRKEAEHMSTTLWNAFANLVTFPVPDFLICKAGAGAKKAWREKVAIFFIFLFISAIFVVMVSFVPVYICVESDQYFDSRQIAQNGWNSIFGKVYDLQHFVDVHPGGAARLEKYFGLDTSRLFARLPATKLPSFCLSELLNETVFNAKNSLGLQDLHCSATEEELFQFGDGACHSSFAGTDAFNERIGKYEKGIFVIPGWDIGPRGLPDGSQVIIIDKAVYNVTRYLDGLRNSNLTIDANHATNENAYLSEPLHNLILNKLNQDATELFRAVFLLKGDQEAIRGCLDELFFHAEIDSRYNPTCDRIALSQCIIAGILGFLILVQVGCSLAYIARRPPMVRPEDTRAAVMIMVPCYNESDSELRKTIDSVLANDYPDENRVLVVVADGIMTGRGEKMSCPETLGNILGFRFSPTDDAHAYESVGALTTNYASVYSGIYTSQKLMGKELKYVVVVKQGGPTEKGTGRAGNRGKRDSQLLLFGILNRMQYNRRPTALDLVFTKTLQDMELAWTDIEFLMAIDADTRISDNAIKFFVHKLEHDKSVLACCGETQVDNKSQSFITMIQVFEYYSAHHLKKAFESVFGCVTCLPGCFTMYRLYTEEFQPLLACDKIVTTYSRNDISSLHERNLYELGEDRMLTTLLLQEFHRMKLSFVPEATCWTIVPHTLQILKSQRRRWINSTLHNMCELLKVQTMCGVCLFSMKMVVIFDLMSTFLLPSGSVYLYYIIVDAIQSTDPLSPLQMLAFAYVGMMALPFIFRAQWDFFFWFIVFLIGGIPAFYFYLPIYAFWNMDDLSWGKTRQVQGSQQAGQVQEETSVSNNASGVISIASGAAADREAEELYEKIVGRRKVLISRSFLVVTFLLIGVAFAVHHFIYDDVLFDHFKKDSQEPMSVEETAGPGPSELDWFVPESNVTSALNV